MFRLICGLGALEASSLALVLTLAGTTPKAAPAPLTLQMTGTVDSTTGIEGAAFGTPTVFSLNAVFDTSNLSLIFPEFEYAPALFGSFAIFGQGTFAATDLLVSSTGPSFPNGPYDFPAVADSSV
jgi:hypothetical protein